MLACSDVSLKNLEHVGVARRGLFVLSFVIKEQNGLCCTGYDTWQTPNNSAKEYFVGAAYARGFGDKTTWIRICLREELKSGLKTPQNF